MINVHRKKRNCLKMYSLLVAHEAHAEMLGM